MNVKVGLDLCNYAFMINRAERHDFSPPLWLLFSPFLFLTKKRGKKKRRFNSKNRDQKSYLYARS